MNVLLTNLLALAERGQKIYQEKFRERYESTDRGRFVAVEVTTEQAFVADRADRAIELGQRTVPNGFFHLVKVGERGAFRM